MCVTQSCPTWDIHTSPCWALGYLWTPTCHHITHLHLLPWFYYQWLPIGSYPWYPYDVFRPLPPPVSLPARSGYQFQWRLVHLFAPLYLLPILPCPASSRLSVASHNTSQNWSSPILSGPHKHGPIWPPPVIPPASHVSGVFSFSYDSIGKVV